MARRLLAPWSSVSGAALALALGACSMTPDYQPPQIAAPAQFKEVAGWTAATPLDDEARGAWWNAFNDPVLSDLEQRAVPASPTLAAALARYDAARAAARVEESDLYPQAGVRADASRERVSAGRPLSTGSAREYSDYVVGGSIAYELDLWGRIRNQVRAATAEAQASEADLASARLSLQAAVADAYFRLRGLDAQAQLLDRSVDAFARAYDLTSKRHSGGIASGIDVNRARTVLGNARAQVATVANQRAATEHEIAALVGELASGFSLAADVRPVEPPTSVMATPSELLQRRPDIAAAERRVFAANSRIGVARAAFFPSLTLGAAGGWETTGGALLTTPNTFWALGPLTSLLTVFDGGRRTAQVKISRAEYEETAADYRATVLGAFRQVEDSIAAIRHLSDASVAQREAAEAARRTSDIAMSRYRDGASGYLDVVTAQTDALEAQRAFISVQTQRMQANVELVRATGGGLPAGAAVVTAH
ncbi:efflux transporter outer membrane subunit [Novosphingobium sp. AP12]|uniref:efflux transporter outer membrane subunit n=1 Tax=Novosphingobium sp. AP12 TaxID=1144305 RepID=UPI0002720AA6|nr:efflux transporter outer membrane subunit [Novosphingobium sp. AP12]EJL30643.1 efflux transporter, outer membrane factor lipoprotein, NodT family [Novosphingobium sp. AP12]